MDQLIAFLTQTQAPWWATLLGTVVGGLITWLTTRLNDNRKDQQALSQYIKDETLKRGLELIEFSNEIVLLNIADKGDRATPEEHTEHLALMQNNMKRIGILGERLQLVCPDDIVPAVKELTAATMALIPKKGDADSYYRARQTKWVLMNKLRVLNRLDELPPYPDNE